MPQKPRLPRNMGRVEFIACFETIDAMRRQGFDNKKIHAALAEKGRLTMSYTTFCYHMARRAKAELAQENHQDSGRTSANRVGTHGRSGFKVEKTPSSGEII